MSLYWKGPDSFGIDTYPLFIDWLISCLVHSFDFQDFHTFRL